MRGSEKPQGKLNLKASDLQKALAHRLANLTLCTEHIQQPISSLSPTSKHINSPWENQRKTSTNFERNNSKMTPTSSHLWTKNPKSSIRQASTHTYSQVQLLTTNPGLRNRPHPQSLPGELLRRPRPATRRTRRRHQKNLPQEIPAHPSRQNLQPPRPRRLRPPSRRIPRPAGRKEAHHPRRSDRRRPHAANPRAQADSR